MMKNKTVYILGAGFSAGVKNLKGDRIPSQEKLMEEIYNHKEHFPKEYKIFITFLINTMGIPEMYHNHIPLEDIFTPLDKCILDGISYRGISSDEAREKRELLNYLIGKTLQMMLPDGVNKRYIDVFAKHLVSKSRMRANHEYSEFDPVSVISTNWDILLDNSVKSELDTIWRNNEFITHGVVDYCCQISSFQEQDIQVKPGLEMLGKGGFNVKLLKLHGSLNWLQCPRCNRLYVDFGSKIAVNQYIDKRKCRHCEVNFGHQNSHILISNLIMPTFIKNLTNSQYKQIWHNCAIELSEASKIVFIGYSLPPADFEMKQMFSRMVRQDAKIEVVDKGDSLTDPKIEDIQNRYEVFFGRQVLMHFRGVEEYIGNHLYRQVI